MNSGACGRGRDRRGGRALAASILAVAAAASAGCAPVHRRAAIPATEVPLQPVAVAQQPVADRPERPPEPERSAAPDPVRHVVRPGETLWRISRAHGVAVADLARANDIADPDVVRVGQLLLVPVAPAPVDGAPLRKAGGGEGVLHWPVVRGRVLSAFGAPRGARAHAGVDIGGRHGQPVVAAQAGRVVFAGETMRGYGNTVIIDHGDDLHTLYAHNSTLLVREGQWVERGEGIARLGRSGRASADHCHFEVRRNDVPVDPMRFLPASADGSAR
jgi:murein DD-endopeptidase MepM/ murein hydrolase activator NlpD